jgi:hypothetical protein
VTEENRRLAFEELMIAEGSDWCWWYGPEHQSENRPEFDELYRQHLANVYRALNLAPPEELSRPILMMQAADAHEPPANPIHAVIDGDITSYFEWMGAGRYRRDIRGGAMHGERLLVRELYYGADQENLYLRLDFDGAPEFKRIELRTAQRSVALLGNPAVQVAQKKIFEARVPFDLLGVSRKQPVSFQIAFSNGDSPVELIPPDGWIDLVDTGA